MHEKANYPLECAPAGASDLLCGGDSFPVFVDVFRLIQGRTGCVCGELPASSHHLAVSELRRRLECGALRPVLYQ